MRATLLCLLRTCLLTTRPDCFFFRLIPVFLATNSESKGSESENAGTAGDYSSSIKHLSTVSTISEFWSTYDYMLRPSALVATTDYHMFRGGISPTWEDEANEKGGKWVVRVRKGLSSQYFEWLIFALIGEVRRASLG